MSAILIILGLIALGVLVAFLGLLVLMDGNPEQVEEFLEEDKNEFYK